VKSNVSRYSGYKEAELMRIRRCLPTSESKFK